MRAKSKACVQDFGYCRIRELAGRAKQENNYSGLVTRWGSGESNEDDIPSQTAIDLQVHSCLGPIVRDWDGFLDSKAAVPDKAELCSVDFCLYPSRPWAVVQRGRKESDLCLDARISLFLWTRPILMPQLF